MPPEFLEQGSQRGQTDTSGMSFHYASAHEAWELVGEAMVFDCAESGGVDTCVRSRYAGAASMRNFCEQRLYL
jgi:hypothetical protein